MQLRILYMKEIHHIDRYINDEYDYYILLPNYWDDYSFQTTFTVKIIKNKQELEEFNIKILFRQQNIEKSSYEIIN